MRSPNPSAMASRTRLSWNREGVSSPLARNLTSSFSTIRTMTTMINVMYKFAVMMRPVGLETASAQKNTTDIMTAHFSSLNFVSPVSRCTLSQSFCAAPNKIPSNHVSGLNMTVSPLIVAPLEGSPNFNVFRYGVYRYSLIRQTIHGGRPSHRRRGRCSPCLLSAPLPARGRRHSYQRQGGHL